MANRNSTRHLVVLDCQTDKVSLVSKASKQAFLKTQEYPSIDSARKAWWLKSELVIVAVL